MGHVLNSALCSYHVLIRPLAQISANRLSPHYIKSTHFVCHLISTDTVEMQTQYHNINLTMC